MQNQITFDPLDIQTDFDPGIMSLEEAHLVARQQRDDKYRELKAHGHKVKRFVLTGQLRKYAGFGQPDGRIRNVYYIQVL